MILNLLNTMLITLGTGASVLTMPTKKPTPPINKAQQNYNLSIGQSNEQETLLQSSVNYQRNFTYKLTGQNSAILVKGNRVISNPYSKNRK